VHRGAPIPLAIDAIGCSEMFYMQGRVVIALSSIAV